MGADPDGFATGDGTVLEAPIDTGGPPGAGPKTIVFGEVPRAVAADPSGVYWGGGTILSGGMATAIQPAPVERISANGVWEIIYPKGVTESMTLCGGGICWTDEAARTLMR